MLAGIIDTSNSIEVPRSGTISTDSRQKKTLATHKATIQRNRMRNSLYINNWLMAEHKVLKYNDKAFPVDFYVKITTFHRN